MAHGVVLIGVHAVGHGAEEGPHAGVAAAHGPEIGRAVGVGEAERLVLTLEVAHLAGELHDVGGVEAVLGIVHREGGDPGLVGVGRDVAVGDAAGHPDDALAGVSSLSVVLVPLADELHDPCLLGIGDRERLAARRISVGVGQVDDHADRLAGRACALQGDVDQRAVVDAAGGVDQLRTSAVGRLADDERVFVHVAHGGVRFAELRDVAEVASRVPLVDGEHRPGLVSSAGGVVEGSVERMGVGRVGHHDRTVGRGSLRDDEVGAGRDRAVSGYGGEGCEHQSEFFHVFRV